MTCHSQVRTGAPLLASLRESLASGKPLEWNRVAAVPDYAYFNHSIHVGRGVPCVECHGRVDQMLLMSRARPFQMQWRLDVQSRHLMNRVEPEAFRLFRPGSANELAGCEAFERLEASAEVAG